MDIAVVAFCKKRCHKRCLQKGFTSGNGDSAGFAEIGTVSLCLFGKGRRGIYGAAAMCPCVGIMAISTAKIASLHENNEADTGTVNGAQCLNGMYIAGCHLTSPRGRYG